MGFLDSLKDKAVGSINAVADYVSESAPVKMASEALTTAKDAVVNTATALKDTAVATAVNVVPSLAANVPGLSMVSGLGKYVPESLKVVANTVVQNIDTLAIAAISPVGAVGYQLAKSGVWKSDDGKLTITKVDGKGLASGTQCTDAVWNAAADYEKAQSNGACTQPEAVSRTSGEQPVTVGKSDESGSLVFTNIFDATGQRLEKSTGAPNEQKQELKVTKAQWDYLQGKTDVAPGDAVQRTSGTEGAAFQDHKYTDDQGREVEVKAGNGQVTITRRGKDGKVETEVKTMDQLTTAEIGAVNARRDVAAGVSTVTTPNGEMSQGPDGVRRLKIGDYTIERSPDGKTVWRDSNGRVISHLTDKLVTVAETAQGKVSMVMPDAQIQELARSAQENLANAPDDKMDVLVSTTGLVIAVTRRMRIDRMTNGNTIFRSRKPDGGESAFMLEKSGKLLHLVDGKFVEADENARDQWKAFTEQLRNIDGAKLDPATGNLTLRQMTAEGRTITIGTKPEEQVRIEQDEQKGPTVTTPQAVATYQGSKIAIDAPTIGRVTWDGQNLETEKFLLTPETMKDKEHGAEIDRAGNITTDHGKGPTIKADGSVDFDRVTSVDADGNVTSGAWRASAGYDTTAAPGGSLEKATQSKITNATADADAVYKKVLNRTVRMSDIGSLDAAYSSISGLLQTFANAGNSQMVAQLIHAMGKINEVRSAAVAPAYAAQLAIEKGISSESQIASIQGRLLTDTPEHAVALTMARAA